MNAALSSPRRLRLKPANRVEGVEEVAGRAGGLGVIPLHVGAADIQQPPRRQLPGDTERELRLSRPWVAGHEQRFGQDQRDVDGVHQPRVRQIAGRMIAGGCAPDHPAP